MTCLRFFCKTIALLSMVSFAYATAPGFYMGMQVGQSNLHNKSTDVQVQDLTTGIITPVNTAASNTGISERLYLGGAINSYAAVEGGYTHYYPTTYSPVQPSNSTPINNPTIRVNVFDIQGKAMLPVQRFTLFAKGGAAYVRQSLAGSITTPTPSGGQNGTSHYLRPIVGVGASYDITQSWVVDVIASRILQGGDFQNADFIGLGISYHFVDQYCGQFLC